MKRICLLMLPLAMILALAITGCKDDSKPYFTRVVVTPSCGVAPMSVDCFAAISGGNESGDPMGANNNLDIAWNFGDGGTGRTSIEYYEYMAPGDYTVTVTGTDPDGNSATAQVMVSVLPDSLTMEALSNFPDGNVTTADTVSFGLMAESCDIHYPSARGDSVKMVYQWTMGIASEDTFKIASPRFRYFNPGTYTAKLTVFYPAWAVSRTDSLLFVVTDP